MQQPLRTSPQASRLREWERSWLDSESRWLSGGGDPDDLPRQALRWLDGGCFLPPRDLLRALEPLLPGLYGPGEPRSLLAQAFAATWNGLHPFVPLTLLHTRTEADRTDLWMLAELPDGGVLVDLAWLLLPLFKVFPKAFGLPEYDRVQALWDPRDVDAILKGAALFHSEVEEDGVEAAPAPRTETLSLRALFHEPFLALERHGTASPVTLVREDYHCRRRRRAVLRSGCAYGAPAFLFRAGFGNHRPDGWNPLSRVLRAALADPDPRSRPVPVVPAPIAAGAPPIQAHNPPHRFVYHRIDDTISCDGRHLTRSVPARILRKLVKDFVLLGQREFEFRAFKRDAEIVPNRKRPNFEVRLRRVQEVIREIPCGLVLHRRRPGLLELEACAPIEYSEEG
jgi:hypothetical protein